MTILDFYNKTGSDFAGVMSRLMKESRVGKFVLMFPSDPSMNQLIECFSAGDIPTAFRAAHTLKGTSANLGFTALYEKACIVTEELRSGNPGAGTQSEINDCKREYDSLCSVIEEYRNTKED